jgi:hypothetical protein
MTTNPLSQVPRELAERLCEEGWLNTGGDSACNDIELAAGEKAATDKVEAVIREAMHIALSHIIAELHEYSDTDMPSDRLIGIDTAIERIRALASSLTEQETTK